MGIKHGIMKEGLQAEDEVVTGPWHDFAQEAGQAALRSFQASLPTGQLPSQLTPQQCDVKNAAMRKAYFRAAAQWIVKRRYQNFIDYPGQANVPKPTAAASAMTTSDPSESFELTDGHVAGIEAAAAAFDAIISGREWESRVGTEVSTERILRAYDEASRTELEEQKVATSPDAPLASASSH